MTLVKDKWPLPEFFLKAEIGQEALKSGQHLKKRLIV